MATLRRKTQRNRYSLNTQGLNAQGFFVNGTASDYPTQANLNDFILAGSPGKVGVFNADSGALLTAAAAVDKIIAQHNSDGTIKKSTVIKEGAWTARKVTYNAPVKQVDHVGWNGASGNLNIAIVGGLQEFVISARNTTPANQPFPVQEGRAVVRSGNPSDFEIIAALIADFNTVQDYENNGDDLFAFAAVVTDAAGTAAGTANALVFANGSNVVLDAGEDTTATFTPGTWILHDVYGAGLKHAYKVAGSVFDGTNTIITLESKAYFRTGAIGESVSVPAASIFTETEANLAAANIGVEIMGVDETVHFSTSVSEDLIDATITHSVAWKQGSGAAWQVAAIEDECAVFDGWTTINEAFPGDYGYPDLWVDEASGDQYNLYFIESMNRVIPSAGSPQNQTLMKSTIIVAAINGSALDTNLTAIFNL